MTRKRRDRLIEENLDLARIIARSVGARLPPYVDLREELHAEALVLLVEAAEKFNPDRGLKFRQWAQWFVNRRIFDLIRRRKLREAKQPHIEDIAAAGSNEETNNKNWEREVDDLDHLPMFSVEANQERHAEAVQLSARVAGLRPRQQTVLRMYYEEGETFLAVGQRLKTTRMKATAIHDEAVAELRKVMSPAA